MALAYDAKRVTRDVDATFVPHEIVHDEAMRVADDLGLPRWRLNEQASVYVSGKNDPGKRSLRHRSPGSKGQWPRPWPANPWIARLHPQRFSLLSTAG